MENDCPKPIIFLSRPLRWRARKSKNTLCMDIKLCMNIRKIKILKVIKFGMQRIFCSNFMHKILEGEVDLPHPLPYNRVNKMNAPPPTDRGRRQVCVFFGGRGWYGCFLPLPAKYLSPKYMTPKQQIMPQITLNCAKIHGIHWP